MKDIYAFLARLVETGEVVALATVIRTDRSAPRHEGSKMIVRSDGSVVGSVGGGAVEAQVVEAAHQTIADARCRRLQFDLSGDLAACGGEVEVFVEPVGEATPCWILGAGHVGRALVCLGRDLPFHFTVVDDRADCVAAACGESGAVGVVAPPAELAARLRPTPRTFVLCATRDHRLDAEYLEALFAAERAAAAEVAWTGLVGSRAKADELGRRFAKGEGFAQRWGRVATPVGLALGAETPAELALSILAEMVAVARKVSWVTDVDQRLIALPLQRSRDAKANERGARLP